VKIIEKFGCTVVSMTPLSMSQRCQWYRCACHSSVNKTAVHIIAVSLTPLCNQYCRISSWMIQSNVFYAEIWFGCTRHSGVIDTCNIVIWTAISLTPLWHAHCTAMSMTQLWLAQRCQWHRCSNFWHSYDFGPHIQDALVTFIGNIYRKKHTLADCPTLYL
jgi:hypothetical protein